MTAEVVTRAAPPTVLRDGRDAVLPAMRAAVGRLDASTAAIAAYHLGWTELDGAPGSGGGKALRPALALLSAQAAGAPAEVGIPGAVSVELLHNFSLVHDDLMDGDTQRRHRPTVWAVWGAASAILTGDALLALALEVLLEGASSHGVPAARLLAETTRALIRGQVQDMDFETRTDVTLTECLEMAAAKTGALLSASATIGAVLAGAPDPVLGALSTYGRQLGLAFQLVDDLLGIWGDPASTGKPVYSDLRAGKKSLPVTYVLTHGGRAGDELAGWLAASECADGRGEGRADEAALRRAADLVQAAGGREWTAAEAQRRVSAAERALAGAPIPDRPRRELTAIARFVVAREA